MYQPLYLGPRGAAPNPFKAMLLRAVGAEGKVQPEAPHNLVAPWPKLPVK